MPIIRKKKKEENEKKMMKTSHVTSKKMFMTNVCVVVTAHSDRQIFYLQF